MAGKKNFINNTNEILLVTLSVRRGDNPNDGISSQVAFPVLPNREHEQEYGDDNDVYLNAIRWTDESRNPLGEVVVEERSDNSDDLMNTNSIMIFSGGERDVRLEGTNY